EHGIAMQTPEQHPFNPLAHLRLLLACAPQGGTPSRYACETVLRDIWTRGGDASEPQRVAALAQTLAPHADPASEPVKAALRDASARAVAIGVFGVPTIAVDDRLFWGVDSLAMLAAYLRGNPWFDGPAWEREGVPRAGVVRG
ncbi:MAG TPA: DsbA family protein, partial [Burkholderiaceae bacterium]|nr:DsbA family protein [Burkholderiaceae bacterium]